MKNPRLFALLIALLLGMGCQPGAAGRAAGAQDLLDPGLLRQDLDYLRDAAVRRHPRFHDQAPGADFVRAFQAVRDSLDRPMTRSDAFRELARVNPAFEDAHSLLLPTFVREQAAGEGGLFPFVVRLDGREQLRVEGDWLDAASRRRIESGATLRAINGEPVARILQDLARYGHGESEALRRRMLTVMFADWLAAIKGWRGAFTLELERNGRTFSLDIAAGDAWAPAPRSAAPDRPSLRDLGGGIALLRLPTFDVDQDPAGYRAAVDEAFASLRQRGATALILDVRGNTGGQSDAGARVIRYLIERPVNQVSRARERLNEDNRGLFGYKGRAGEMREMDLSRDGLIQPAPAAQRFCGRVVLLIDAMTYSAGILFATTLQDHGLATLIGEPTGGHANQTGNMEPVRLPHSGLVAYLPARIFVRPSGQAGAEPVRPDIAIAGRGREGDALQAAIRHLQPGDASRSPPQAGTCRG